ncbi:hypothetical protein F5883DRAFT_544196 [Diaporthe sp. PMI_573]|nr:hypothetical protein F5883DRAFT_544196 [Diaporthaceae sp. PMI_573]
MAEVLGLGVNIATVIDLSAKVAVKCVQYANEVKNARAEISRVQRETLNLKIVAEKTKELLEGDHRASLQACRELSCAIQETTGQLHQLCAELSFPDTAPRLWGLRALQWPFQSKNVERVVQDIARCSQSISETLQIDQTSILLNLDQKTVLDRLPTASGASFDSHAEEHNPTCLPNTRVDLLKEICAWIDNPGAQAVFWLNGMAGTGKSTISRTVARSLDTTDQLGASFFFKRGETDRSAAAKLFTTIASQLARRIPALTGHITEAIDAEPTIHNKTLREQFEKLIFEPFSKIQAQAYCSAPVAIVVDALDECEGYADIKMIINLFSHAKNLQSPKLKVLLTSRPELPVTLGFNQKEIEGTYTDFILHKIPEPIVEHDISVFLEYQLALIKDNYNSIIPNERKLPPTGPGQGNIQTLIKMAVPLFIFAATTCRFLQQRGFAGPDQQLRQVLDYKTRVQSSGLDLASKFELTYQPALNQQLADLSPSEQDETIKQFRRIVGAIVILSRPLSIIALAQLLDVPIDVIGDRLDMLHSVLDVPKSSIFPVRLLHLSFRDFLVDFKQRDRNPFWVDEEETHRQLAERCLTILKEHLRTDICDLQSPATLRTNVDPLKVNLCLPPEVQYACFYWTDHTHKARSAFDLTNDVYTFLSQHFLHWLEVLSLLGKAYEAASLLQSLQSDSAASDENNLQEFVRDAIRFIRLNLHVINIAPLQLYSSALVFTPYRSVVRQIFEENIPQWIVLKPDVEIDWNQCFQKLEGHSGNVWSVAFSHDSAIIASASDDKTVRIWRTHTGECIQELKGHSDRVASVAFSYDSAIIASASWDKIVRIWRADMGDCIQELEGHSNLVTSVAFSHDSVLIASSSFDGAVRIWCTDTGECMKVANIGGTTSRHLSFDKGNTCLRTDRGAVVLHIATSELLSLSPEAQPRLTAIPEIETGISQDGCWVIWKDHNLLWLPTEFRPLCSAVHGCTLVVGCSSGRVIVVRLSRP